MSREQDWAEKKAIKILCTHSASEFSATTEEGKNIINGIAQALREARASALSERSKLEWPTDEEIMAAHDIVAKQSWGSIYHPSVWAEAVDWLKSYIEGKRNETL